MAESVPAAIEVVRSGVPSARVWALALPSERLYLAESTEDKDGLAYAASVLGGFLTDSELARNSLERAMAATRVRVEVFPPIATDRPCPTCQSRAELVEGANDAGVVPPEVALLGRWRAMIDQLRSGGPAETQYSFALARLFGFSPEWTPDGLSDWSQDGSASRSRRWEAPAVGWSGAAQARAARAVLDLTAQRTATPAGVVRPARTVLVAGFDLKFVRELAARLDLRSDLDITVDDWPTLSRGTKRTEALVGRAESILAEWARPSAVWLSQRKRPGQFLVVRLHRYELDWPYPRNIVMDNVDAVVHVSSPIGQRIQDELGWPAVKLVHIPNFLDVGWFDRPKLPDARFGIGFVGMESANKRFDLALDVLTELRRHDPRFTLFVRSAMPWDNRYVWWRPEERRFVAWCFERIEQDPLLRGAVHFDTPGRDMARWYRRVGHVLSMSDIESFHLAAAEGMASGAVPVIRPWPGAADIYGKEWIHASVEDAAAAALASVDADAWVERAARAKAEIRRTADPAAVVQAWADLLHGDIPGARSHF
jgi:glycosyltransferase involved in cell wall biosynthesis